MFCHKRYHQESDSFQSIILFDNDDMKIPSFHKNILKYTNNLEGTRHWGIINSDKCSCCNKPFKIKNLIDKHKLYIYLPKDDIYICAEQWTNEFMKSQTSELINIFKRLGANEIEIEIINNNKTIDINYYNFITNNDTSIEIEIGNNNNNFILTLPGRKLSCILDKHSDMDYIDMIMNDTKYYYIHSNIDWVCHINERIKDNITNLTYRHTFKNNLDVSEKLKKKLQKFNIKTDISNKNNLYEYMNMKIKFS